MTSGMKMIRCGKKVCKKNVYNTINRYISVLHHLLSFTNTHRHGVSSPPAAADFFALCENQWL